jgi:hypothetical protein
VSWLLRARQAGERSVRAVLLIRIGHPNERSASGRTIPPAGSAVQVTKGRMTNQRQSPSDRHRPRLHFPPFPQRSGVSHSVRVRHSCVAKLTSLPWRTGRQQMVSPGQSPESSQAYAMIESRVLHALSKPDSVFDSGAATHSRVFFPERCSQQISPGSAQSLVPQRMKLVAAAAVDATGAAAAAASADEEALDPASD